VSAHSDPDRAAELLVKAARLMASRLGDGGRIVARGAGRTLADARHVAVEFLHPVIVGKPALPALVGGAMADGGDLIDVLPVDVVVGIAYGGATLAGRVDVAISDKPVPGAEVQIELPSSEAAAKHAAVVSYHVLWEMTHPPSTRRCRGGGPGRRPPPARCG
jgi:D-sedoheptulose 7-phosphate isomerase